MTDGKKDYKRIFPVSWEQLHRDSKALAWRLLEHDYFKGIVAITRGGLVPAAIVARELDIRLVDTVCVSSYDWQDHRGEVEILKTLRMDGDGWLIDRRPGRHRQNGADRARYAAQGPFCHRLRQTRRPAPGGHFYHRGQPGHLDPVSLGRGVPVRAADRRIRG